MTERQQGFDGGLMVRIQFAGSAMGHIDAANKQKRWG